MAKTTYDKKQAGLQSVNDPGNNPVFDYDKEQARLRGEYQQSVTELNNTPGFDYNKFTSEYQKKEKPLVDILMSSYNKPTPQVTPEQERRARTASAIGDSLSSLADIFASTQGANVRLRDGATSSQQTDARLKEIRDRYERDQMNYNNLRANAIGNDFSSHLKNEMEASGQKRQNILYRANQAYKQMQENTKAKTKAEEDAEKIRQFNEKLKEDKRANDSLNNYRQSQLGQSWNIFKEGQSQKASQYERSQTESERHNKVMEPIAQQNADTAANGGFGGGKPVIQSRATTSNNGLSNKKGNVR